MANNSTEISDLENYLDYVNLDMRAAVLPVTVLVGIENVVGLFGNIMIVLVYSRQYKRTSFRYFVLFMGCIDLTSCLSCVPGEVFSQLYWYKYELSWVCKVKSYFNVFGAWGSASILLLLAIDRYRKVCHPFARQIKPSLTLTLCVSAVICSAIVAAPVLLFWGTQTYLYERDHISVNVSVCEKSHEYSTDTSYPFWYIMCVYVVSIGLMMITITTLNILTTKRLFCDRRRRPLSDITNNVSSTDIFTVSERVTTTAGHDTVLYMETNSIRNYVQPDTQVKEPANSDNTSAGHNIFEYDNRQSASLRNDPTPETERATVKRSDHNEILPKESDRPRPKANGIRDISADIRIRRKTMIMLVLTTVFVITMSVYIALVTLIAEQNILQELSNSRKAVYFLFLRLYFINCVINPFLYGFVDPRFRTAIKQMFS